MTDPKTLFSTKAKRTKAAARIADLAERLGVDCTIEPAPLGDRELWVRLAFGPYRCQTDLDGATACTAYLAHWHADHGDQEATYPADFGVTIGGTVNECHRRKATTFADDFDGLLASLQKGFERLQSNTAKVA